MVGVVAVTHLCVRTVVPSFRDIDYLAYIANLVFTDYYFLCYFYVSLKILISFGNFGLVAIKIYNNHSHNVNVVRYRHTFPPRTFMPAVKAKT